MREAATSISATMREVEKTGGYESPASRLSALARSVGATSSSAAAVALISGSFIRRLHPFDDDHLCARRRLPERLRLRVLARPPPLFRPFDGREFEDHQALGRSVA